MKRQELQSKIDKISSEIFTLGHNLHTGKNDVYDYTGKMLKNVSFQLDDLVEFLSARHIELDALEK